MKLNSFLLLILIILPLVIENSSFDLSQTSKHGNVMNSQSCNKDTIIDFDLSPSTTITCSGTDCKVNSPLPSQIQFLDVGGIQQTYTLQDSLTDVYKITAGQSRPEQKALIKLGFSSSSGKKLYVGIPFSDTISSLTTPKPYELDLKRLNDPAFTTLKEKTDFNNFHLSALNFLNIRDYGHFYHLANDPKQPTTTYLLAYYVISNYPISTANLESLGYNFPISFNPNADTYKKTGDKLCWGSKSFGIFQTHLRESYPLWAAWLGILFYWLYILLADSNTISCYDKKFEENKWTCWGIYSLHHLGHEEYFTRLSRTTLMLITFSWEGFILAIIYSSSANNQKPVIILWAAVIAAVTALPYTFVIGYLFLRRIYKLTLHKYDIMKKMKGVFNKKDSSMAAYEKDIDDTEESLYGYYYWYYVLAFVLFTVFWVLAIQQMMRLNRDYYYFMHYWLASLGVALGLEHLFFDPIFTLLLGNTSFYRFRGFYYDFKLGQRFKEIEE